MRTSRLSQETSRAMDALRSSSHRQTRASARNHVATAENRLAATEIPNIEESVPVSVRSPSRKKRRVESSSATESPQPTRATSRRAGVKTEEDQDQPVSHSRRPPRRQPMRQEVQKDGEVVIHPPANWKEVYDLTSQMRKLNPAPVDTMGCETLAEEGLSNRDRRFQTLIALMLSSQTKDTVTAVAIQRLQTELPRPGLTLERILAVEPDNLNELIRAVGFHNNKTKFIKRTAEVLRDQFDGDIPDTIEGLTSLPGVGPKMAYLCMSSAWGRDEGIGVDVHVHRITNLWGWHKTKTPEETRAALESWLPREKWHDINHLLVGFGQTICAPVGRNCDECILSEKGLCPSAVVSRKIKVAKFVRLGKNELVAQEEDVTVDGSNVKTEAMVKTEEV